jgi:hypothetical protein
LGIEPIFPDRAPGEMTKKKKKKYGKYAHWPNITKMNREKAVEESLNKQFGKNPEIRRSFGSLVW